MKEMNMTLNELLPEGEPLTFLVGAGCSVDAPSCLPAGRPMMNAIINHVTAASEHEKLANLQELRFESLIEIVRDNLDPGLKIIDYYGQCDKPNLQHFFLASMIEQGHFVMTTNFDFLIEHAILQLGIPRERVKIAITKKDFERFNDPTKVLAEGFKVVYKIHGSTENLLTKESTRESLIATIHAFGSNKQGLSVFQVEPFKRLLFENISRGRIVVVMGYSGSDDFDVVPTLKVLREMTSIIWIDHRYDLTDRPIVYEIEVPNKNLNENEGKVDQILRDIKLVSNIPHVYKVEMNTSSFSKFFLSRSIPLSTKNFELKPQVWLSESLKLDNESIKYIIPQQLYHDYNHYEDSLRCSEELLKLAYKQNDPVLGVRALLLKGKIRASAGHHDEALRIFEDAIKLARKLQNEEWIAASLNNIANVYNNQAKYTEALSYFEQALPIFQSMGKLHEEGIVLRNMSSILKNLNKNSEAIEHATRALEISELLGKLSDKGDILMIMGTIETSLGNVQDAIKHYEESLRINDQLHDYDAKIGTLNVLGDLMIKLGDFNRGLGYLQDSLHLSESINDFSGKASTLNNLGRLNTILSNFSEAIKLLNLAENLAREIHDPLIEANSSSNTGLVYYYQGHVDEALKIWEKTLKTYEKTNFDYGKATTLINIGDVYYQKQKYKKASQALEEALKIGKDSNDVGIQASVLQKLGMILQDQKDHDKAAVLYHEGLTICQQIGDIVGIATFINNLGTVDFYRENYGDALQKYNEAFTLLRQVGLGESPLAHTIIRNIDHLNQLTK
jgi:tetratricopeptide (TPR) repeat protein